MWQVLETWTEECTKSGGGEIHSKGGGTYLGTKQETDRLESLTHATSKPQPFVRSSEGGSWVGGGILFHFHFPDGRMALLSWGRLSLSNIATVDVSSPESFVIIQRNGEATYVRYSRVGGVGGETKWRGVWEPIVI